MLKTFNRYRTLIIMWLTEMKHSITFSLQFTSPTIFLKAFQGLNTRRHHSSLIEKCIVISMAKHYVKKHCVTQTAVSASSSTVSPAATYESGSLTMQEAFTILTVGRCHTQMTAWRKENTPKKITCHERGTYWNFLPNRLLKLTDFFAFFSLLCQDCQRNPTHSKLHQWDVSCQEAGFIGFGTLNA